MDIWTTPATSHRPGVTDTALLLRYPDGTVVPVGVQSGHTAREFGEVYAELSGYTLIGAQRNGEVEYVDRVITVLVSDLIVGDTVVVHDSWTFRIGRIDEGRIARTIRDERGIAWREPSPLEEIKIQIAGEDPRERILKKGSLSG
jgi:hypothetical protein